MVTAVQLRNATRGVLGPIIGAWNDEFESGYISPANNAEGFLLTLIDAECRERWPNNAEMRDTVRDYLVQRLINENPNNTNAGVAGAINELQEEVRLRPFRVLSQISYIGVAYANNSPDISNASRFLERYEYTPATMIGANLGAYVGVALDDAEQDLDLSLEQAQAIARAHQLSGSSRPLRADVLRVLATASDATTEPVPVERVSRSEQPPVPVTQASDYTVGNLQRLLERRFDYETGRLAADGSLIRGANGRADNMFGDATQKLCDYARAVMVSHGVVEAEVDTNEELYHRLQAYNGPVEPASGRTT